jgi:hypothetical protein
VRVRQRATAIKKGAFRVIEPTSSMLKNRCQVQKSYSQGAARNGQSAGGYYSSSWSYYWKKLAWISPWHKAITR